MSSLAQFLTPLLALTLEWLGEPPTWAAVALPAVITARVLWLQGLSKWDWLAVIGGAGVSCAFSKITEVDGCLELHSPAIFACALVVVVGLRWYLPSAGRAFTMCWLVLITSDFVVMATNSSSFPSMQLPMGIGGAGFGDALFIEPVLVCIGLLALKWARSRGASRLATQASPLQLESASAS